MDILFTVTQRQKADWVEAFDNDNTIGHALLDYNPKYNLYRKLNIPEIQDLFVAPEYRRQGIGEKLVRFCENRARDKGYMQTGISVGLHSGFGTAQRLYIKMGYVPDGAGVTYDRASVQAHALLPISDDLCLMMVKNLI